LISEFHITALLTTLFLDIEQVNLSLTAQLNQLESTDRMNQSYKQQIQQLE